jgi:hypothetical protein
MISDKNIQEWRAYTGGTSQSRISIALLLAFERSSRRLAQVRSRFPLSAAGRTPPFINDACWRVAGTAGSRNDISALAGIRALTSRTARISSGHPRRPASFEVSVKMNGADDRAHGSLLYFTGGSAVVSLVTDAYKKRPVIALM